MAVLAEAFTHQDWLVLDGGFATWSEHYGVDLDHPLWSSRLLEEDPELVARVHLDYLVAGADCITSNTYQASFEGWIGRGHTRREAERLLREGVLVAQRARHEFEQRLPARRLRPLVAASVGPYGAFLADGSEYTGDYGVSARELEVFHAQRLRLLAAAGPDVLALETIPSGLEARVLHELVDRLPEECEVWFSFCCRDDRHLADGTALEDVVPGLESERVVAVGVNCVAPSLVAGLLEVLGPLTDRPLLAYPNSGEVYRAEKRDWAAPADEAGLPALAPAWLKRGAKLIGGCCRTTPHDISALRSSLEVASAPG